MTDPFYSPKRRVRRAKKHFGDLAVEIDAFCKSDPCADVVELDDDGLQRMHKFKLIKPLPESLADITVDALGNMRSALDQAGYVTAVASGCADPKRAYFPFASSAADLENVIKGRCKDIPQDIVTLFRTFQPYKGGDDLLWALNRIRTANEHRIITGVGLSSGGMHMLIDTMTMGPGGFIGAPRWNSAKQELVYAVTKPGTEFSYKGQFSFHIAFGDIEVIGGQEILTVLNSLLSKVEGIVLATEAESKRIGIIT
ncbi:hypothetical protein MnTg02_00397 [bacterium MnTg02]|nr:hypothetical protein MnTg02_00397 [bacterium MnTg02]